MESLLVVHFLHGLLLDVVEFDEFLQDVGQERRLLAGLRVLVLDHRLSHEVVDVILFLQVFGVEFGIYVSWCLLVMQFLGEFVHIIIEGYVGILTLYDDLIGPYNVISVNRSNHLLLDILHKVISCFIFID